MTRSGRNAHPSHKQCKACAKHAWARTRWYGVHLVEISNQPVHYPSEQQVEATRDGASETSHTENYELHGKAGQTVRPSHRHCNACVKHDHVPWSRAHTGTTVYVCTYTFFLLSHLKNRQKFALWSHNFIFVQ